MIKCIDNHVRADYDILVDSFIEDIDLRKLSKFPLISIYFNSTDFPDKYIARVFDIRPGEVFATRYIMIKENLEEIRRAIPDGFSHMDKTPKDDLELVEVWV